MNVVGHAHQRMVHGRRVRVLSERLAANLPQNALVLDVGAGDGLIDSLILERRPDLRIRGIDVLVRADSFIEVTSFDGSAIPFPQGSFDVVMFVDVLHHTADPTLLLREAKRVSSQMVLIKDHTREGFLAGTTLRFMDWVGNAHHGVALPYHYWPESRWRTTIEQLGLVADAWWSDLHLYAFPASLIFDRKLQFIARLKKEEC